MDSNTKISELERIVSSYEASSPDEKSSSAKFVLEFILKDDKIMIILRMPFFQKLFELLEKFRILPSLNQYDYRNCYCYMESLLQCKNFFFSKKRTFLSQDSCLSVKIEDVEQLYTPLSVLDACRYMNMLVEQQGALFNVHVLGVQAIFMAGIRQGLFDNVIAVMNETVKCKTVVPVPSSTFPYPSQSLAHTITASFQAFWYSCRCLKYRADMGGGSLDFAKILLNGFHHQFFGRLIIAKRGDVENKERKM